MHGSLSSKIHKLSYNKNLYTYIVVRTGVVQTAFRQNDRDYPPVHSPIQSFLLKGKKKLYTFLMHASLDNIIATHQHI